MSEKDLDNLFKSKLGERAFEYNPKAWQAMEQILDSRKRGLAFYWRSAAAVLAFFGLSLIFALNQPEIVSTNTQQNKAVSATQKQKNTVPAAAEFENNSAKENAMNNEKNGVSNDVVVANPAALNTAVAEENTAFNSTKKNELNEKPSLGATNQNNTSNATAFSAQEDEKALAVANEKLLTENDFVVLPELKLKQIVVDANRGAVINTDKRPPFSAKKLGLFPFVRISGMSSSINLNATNGYGFSIGGGVEKTLGSNFSVATSINYVQRSRPGLNKSSDSTFYKFAAERIFRREEILRTHHVELPLTFTYLANSRHRIGAGFSAAYLFGSEATVDLEKSKSDELIKRDRNTEAVVKHDLNTWNFGAHVQYQFLIAPRFSMGTSLHYSFSDFTLDTPTEQRLTDVRLFLQYAF